MEKINLIILVSIIMFLLYYFTPGLLLLQTTTSGGDTASHYYSASYLKNHLLPQGKIIGWLQGNYAGMPLFQFYFFFPFLLIALLSFMIPLQISFKLVTVLGIFSLPLSVFFSLKLMKFKHPTPIVASIFTLPFLFIESNSMWGGNIPSTLAGEFAYSIGLSFSILFFGLLYKGIKEKKFLISNILLLSIIALNHVYTLLWSGFSSFYYFKKNPKYLIKLWTGSFLLICFWFIPLISKKRYTATYADMWDITFSQVFPMILLPFVILAVYGLIKAFFKKNEQIIFFSFAILTAFIFYMTSYYMGFVDIRFIPFIQISIIIISAYGFVELFGNKKFLPMLTLILVIIFVQSQVTYIDDWIKWNYSGFENKEYWPYYKEINDLLNGTVNDPRIVYEHSMEHDKAGTPRAFESIPLFSGRSTLEGLYMQSTFTAPFIFYIQSEISEQQSCPFPNRKCTFFNLTAGTKHLRLFNVKHFIAISNKVKSALKNSSEYKLIDESGPYQVYELTTNENHYVTVPEYYPIKVNYKDFYLWFKDPEPILIYSNKNQSIQKIKINKTCEVQELIKEEEILFNTTCPKLPHLIKISYFPNWKSKNKEKIYLASPSFMLIYPENEQNRIYYGTKSSDILGKLLSIIGIFFILYLWKHSQ